MTTTWVYAGVFFGFLAVAAASDVRDLRIPNRLSFAMAACAPVAMWLFGPGAEAIPMALLTGAVTLAIGWTLFELGWLGGGDAKLATAAALWLGPDPTLAFAVLTALGGALLATVLLVLSRWGAARALVGTRWRVRLEAETIAVPYALAMAPAGAGAMWLRLLET